MKTNSSMRRLLDSMGLSLAGGLIDECPENLPEIVDANGSVLLASEYQMSRSDSLKDFPDRTGYECFVNHVHIPYDGTPASLSRSIAFVAGIRKNLTKYAIDRRFLIIMSVAEGECVVRFHECRAGEAWVMNNLETYSEEAIVTLSVGGTTNC